LVLLLATGCYTGALYQTHLGPGMTLDLRVVATKAALDWEQHTRVKLDVHTDNCPTLVRSSASICVFPVDSIPSVPWEPGELTGYTLLNNVWIATPKLEGETEAYQQRLIAHELGHAMGLSHDVEGTLMYPYRDKGSLTVTPRDVAQWEAKHPR
jgi:hypothetical protein